MIVAIAAGLIMLLATVIGARPRLNSIMPPCKNSGPTGLRLSTTTVSSWIQRWRPYNKPTVRKPSMITTRNIWLLAVILIMIGLLLQGCVAPSPPQLIQAALPLPTRPVLPAIKSTELSCLSDDVYFRLATRNRLQRQYAEQLEVIIKSTAFGYAQDGHQIRDSPGP